MVKGTQLAKYFLTKWQYFEMNYNYLTDSEIDNMKVLYASLKELSQEDVSILAAKYKVKQTDLEDNGKPYLRDAIVAELLDLELNVYVNQRKLIETKLNRFIIKYRELYGEQIKVPDKLGS